MNYLPEEHIEDAVAAYLSRVLPSGLLVFPAYGRLRITYPCVVVAVVSNDNSNEALNWNDQRLMRVELQLLIEARKSKVGGWQVAELRETSKRLRRALVSAIAADGAREEIAGYGGFVCRQILVNEITRNAMQPIMETTIPVELLVLPTDDLET